MYNFNMYLTVKGVDVIVARQKQSRNGIKCVIIASHEVHFDMYFDIKRTCVILLHILLQ